MDRHRTKKTECYTHLSMNKIKNSDVRSTLDTWLNRYLNTALIKHGQNRKLFWPPQKKKTPCCKFTWNAFFLWSNLFIRCLMMVKQLKIIKHGQCYSQKKQYQSYITNLEIKPSRKTNLRASNFTCWIKKDGLEQSNKQCSYKYTSCPKQHTTKKKDKTTFVLGFSSPTSQMSQHLTWVQQVGASRKWMEKKKHMTNRKHR